MEGLLGGDVRCPHASPITQGCHGVQLGKSAEADVLRGSGTIVFLQPETPSAWWENPKYHPPGMECHWAPGSAVTERSW